MTRDARTINTARSNDLSSVRSASSRWLNSPPSPPSPLPRLRAADKSRAVAGGGEGRRSLAGERGDDRSRSCCTARAAWSIRASRNCSTRCCRSSQNPKAATSRTHSEIPSVALGFRSAVTRHRFRILGRAPGSSGDNATTREDAKPSPLSPACNNLTFISDWQAGERGWGEGDAMTRDARIINTARSNYLSIVRSASCRWLNSPLTPIPSPPACEPRTKVEPLQAGERGDDCSSSCRAARAAWSIRASRNCSTRCCRSSSASTTTSSTPPPFSTLPTSSTPANRMCGTHAIRRASRKSPTCGEPVDFTRRDLKKNFARQACKDLVRDSRNGLQLILQRYSVLQLLIALEVKAIAQNAVFAVT
jgi:hypothetical protein